MRLRYPDEWNFEDIGISIPGEALSDFYDLATRIAAKSEAPQRVLEAFKSAFGVNAWSTSPDWAETDLYKAMAAEVSNAVSFVAAYWKGIQDAKQEGAPAPPPSIINSILDKHRIPLVIDLPHLKRKEGDVTFVSKSMTSANSSASTYQRGEIIGRGGFGVVYRVTRTTSVGEFVFAMKVLNPSPFIENKERALARFSREMQILSTLQHRGIVQHLEAGLDEDQRPYILMPLIQGADIRNALSGAEPSKVFAAFDEVLHALEYAHSRNIIHRDLRPSNVLIRSSDGQPIILDFGCAYSFDDLDQETLTTTLIGTAQYIPVEVIRDPKNRTVKQDIYACGVLLYEVIAQCLPNSEDYSPIEDSRFRCNELNALLRQALAPERKRFESALTFRKHLHAVAALHLE